MNELLILGGITAAAWIGLLLLRVPSSIAFLSLLIGQLLANQASADVYSFISTLTHVSDELYIQIALLVLPLGLTVLFMRGRVTASKRLIEAVPILLVVALTMVLLGPLFEPLGSLIETATNGQSDAYKSMIVVAASVAALLSAWLSYPRPLKDHKDKH